MCRLLNIFTVSPIPLEEISNQYLISKTCFMTTNVKVSGKDADISILGCASIANVLGRDIISFLVLSSWFWDPYPSDIQPENSKLSYKILPLLWSGPDWSCFSVERQAFFKIEKKR